MLPDIENALELDDDFDPIGVALRVARAVEACGGAYFVGTGGAGTSEHQAPGDAIGIVLDLPIGRVHKFVSELGREFEVGHERVIRDALLLGKNCRILYVPTALDVDLFAIGRTEFDAVEFARRRRVTVRPDGETLFVKSVEDSVLRKLLEFLDQGLVSDREWRDAVQILCIGGAAIDFAHLELWAKRLGVAEMLEQARSESAATHVAR